jgi:hypothetical protein
VNTRTEGNQGNQATREYNMLIDKENLFCTAQAATSTAAIGDIIDLGTGGVPDGGLQAFVNVDTVFAGTAASYVQFGLQACDASGFGTDPVVVAESGTIGLASLAASTRAWTCKIPPTSKRYLRLYFTSSVIMTGGKVDAGLVMDDQTNA